MRDLVDSWKEFCFDSEWSGKLFEGFDQNSDIIWLLKGPLWWQSGRIILEGCGSEQEA